MAFFERKAFWFSQFVSPLMIDTWPRILVSWRGSHTFSLNDRKPQKSSVLKSILMSQLKNLPVQPL